MAYIANAEVYGLASTIYRSGYPMMSAAPSAELYKEKVAEIERCIDEGDLTNVHIKRAINLATAQGGGHDQFLTGIVVNFDMCFSNKAWVEAERYTFLNFISSMSTMHRIARFSIADCCNGHTSAAEIAEAERLQAVYNAIPDEKVEEKKSAYLDLLYNLPSGFELMAAMTTNYRSLKNIYAQRRTHRLPDWHVFCDWVETLPLAKELICGNK